MKQLLREITKKYFISLADKILEDPVKNIISALISLFIIFVMSQQLLFSFGLFPFISYLIICIYGFSRIIDNPYRPLVWSVGFVVGTTAINILFNDFIPIIQGGDMVSLFSGIIILYIVGILLFKSRELKGF